MKKESLNIWTNLPQDWKSLLSVELQKPYVEELNVRLAEELQSQTVYPPINQVFSAFESCSVEACKVVLIGQDPYHGKGQANGLCFSVHKDQKLPPSLKNILTELEKDVGVQLPHGDLSHWAKQGVLMLNRVLTVREGEANSHKKLGWPKFTKAVVAELSNAKEGLIFLLWGGEAQKLIKLIDSKKHVILSTGHPSPLSANRGYWFGNKSFSRCNTELIKLQKEPINW